MKCIKCGHAFNEEKWDNICPKCSTYNREDSYSNYMRQDATPTRDFQPQSWEPPSYQRENPFEEGESHWWDRPKARVNPRASVRPNTDRRDAKARPKLSVRTIILLAFIALNVIPLILSLLGTAIYSLVSMLP